MPNLLIGGDCFRIADVNPIWSNFPPDCNGIECVRVERAPSPGGTGGGARRADRPTPLINGTLSRGPDRIYIRLNIGLIARGICGNHWVRAGTAAHGPNPAFE